METAIKNVKKKKYSKSSPYLFVIALLTSICMSPALAEDRALILRGDTAAFEEVVSGLKGDLGEDLAFSEYIVDKDTEVSDIKKLMSEATPKVVILVGNHAMNSYTKLQQSNDKLDFPPAVALAALYIDKLVKKMTNTTGIRYEIPAVTGIVNLRSLLNSELKKVGVIYRSWMKDFIEENARYSKREEIELVGYEISGKNKNVAKEIKKGVKQLLAEKVDAFWIVNDNGLLTKDALIGGWIPSMQKAEVPVIVGVTSLVQSKFKFGSYAIVPDHYALGVQGASIIAEIMEEDWQLETPDVQQPISVKKLLNQTIFDSKKINYKEAKLAEIDEVIH
tara:strand:- start:23549 stop:24553 length:1005 start_codon:yes stop_codon:yes gene_type:complete